MAQAHPSPLALTDSQLRAEADALARRIAASALPVRDAMLVIELAKRLEHRNPSPSTSPRS